MGRIKEIFIELKREYKDFDEVDLPYLFKQYVKTNYPDNVGTMNAYAIHKETAIKALEGSYRNPAMFSKEQLADLLERHYPSKNRQYLVLDDDVVLVGHCINNINEF